MGAADTWVFRVMPHPEESLGHFLGRFRRANHLSTKIVAEHLGVRLDWVQAWETPSRRRNPSPLQLIALSKLTDVAPEHLAQMLPPEPLHLGTRLCPVCYGQQPVHRWTWQRAGVDHCEHHPLVLLSHCPACGAGFRTPALWEEGRCEHCGLGFSQMASVGSPP